MIGASGAVMAVVMLFTLFYPKREIIFFFIPMPMWMLLVIFLVFPLIADLERRHDPRRRRVAPGRGGFAFLFKQFDLRWSRLVSGRVFRPRLRIFSPVPREPTRSRSPSPSRTTASVGQHRQVLSGFRASPKSSSTRGSTRCSPRSPAKAARA